MSDLAGRRGLVLGVSSESSLGFACAERCRQQGAEIIITRRSLSDSDGVAARLRALGCEALEWDARQAGAAAKVAEQVRARWGRLDFVIHTLMHVPPEVLKRPLLDLKRQELAEIMHVGVYSLIELCGATADLLAASTTGRVIALSSENSRFPSAHYHVAGITKGALESAVRYLALELGEKGITCNAISAGPLSTAGANATLGEAVMQQTRAHIAKRALSKRATEAADVASLAAFLASADSGNITAQVLVVDGGFSRRYL
jgi:enoyl-[acyl-carrier protein] reductase I